MNTLWIYVGSCIDIKELPKKYVDLMDDPSIKKYLALAEKLKADVNFLMEEKHKKMEDLNAVINEINESFGQLTKGLNTDISFQKKVELVRNDLKEITQNEMQALNKSLWNELFEKINFNTRIDSEVDIFKGMNYDFNRDQLLKCFKLIDSIIGVKHTAYLYEKFDPYLDYKVLKDGDIVLSLNSSVDLKAVKSRNIYGRSEVDYIASDDQRLVLYRRNFYWLINFIIFNYQGSLFKLDRLDKKFNTIHKTDCFQKYGITLFPIKGKDRYKLKISKEYLPLLEQQIGFKVKN